MANFFEETSEFIKGLGLTFSHLIRAKHRRKPMAISSKSYFSQEDGLVTIQYPKEKIPVPDNGRYLLHLETPDCIGCDQCARICPVNCITIETLKAVEDLGLTSDGTKKKLWLPVFDIDMAKCFFCGLCTTVCPTECLVMTDVYDFSTQNRDDFIYHYGNLSPEELIQKRRDLEAFELAKKLAKEEAINKEKTKIESENKSIDEQIADNQENGIKNPVLKKKILPPKKEEEINENSEQIVENQENVVKNPVLKKKIIIPKKEEEIKENSEQIIDNQENVVKNPVLKKKILPKKEEENNDNSEQIAENQENVVKNPVLKKKLIIPKKEEEITENSEQIVENQENVVRNPVLKKKLIIPKKEEEITENSEQIVENQENAVKNPVIKKKLIIPKKEDESQENAE